jgi:hypothetical protein
MSATFRVDDGEVLATIPGSRGKLIEYRVTAELPGGSDHIFLFARVDGRAAYTVCVDGRETLCNCPATTYRSREVCKHSLAALDLAALVAMLAVSARATNQAMHTV